MARRREARQTDFGDPSLTLFWLRNWPKARISNSMFVSRLRAAPVRFCVLFLTAAALSACATTQLPDAPKTSGATANPHYKVGAPYKIAGRWYVPQVDETYDQKGVASWYGDAFHGKLTANGEIFDKGRISAAHKTLPLPTLVEVENLENGRKLVVRVNDRGPFVDDRIIDLSHAAADELGFTTKGLARVRVRYIGETDVKALAALPGDKTTKPVKLAEKQEIKAPVARQEKATPGETTKAEENRDVIAALIASSTNSGSASAPMPPQSAANEYWVEIVRLNDLSELSALRLDIPELGPVSVQQDANEGAARQSLRIGPFLDEAIAFASLSRVQAAGFSGARILRGVGG
jgi:rare lipoprotein A